MFSGVGKVTIRLSPEGSVPVFSVTTWVAVAAPVIKENNALKMELQSLVNAINNNEATAVTEVDGYRAMEVAHLILDKISRNQIS